MNNKMMEKALGINNTVSEIDLMVKEDESIISAHLEQKANRAERRRSTKKEKDRNKRIYNPYDVAHWGKKAAYNSFRGVCPVFHGQDEPAAFIKKSRKNVGKQTLNKVENRKVRYEAIPQDFKPFEEWYSENKWRFADPSEEEWVWKFNAKWEYKHLCGIDVYERIEEDFVGLDPLWEEWERFKEVNAFTFDEEGVYHDYIYPLYKTLAYDDRVCSQIIAAKAAIIVAAHNRKMQLLDEKISLLKREIEINKELIALEEDGI